MTAPQSTATAGSESEDVPGEVIPERAQDDAETPPAFDWPVVVVILGGILTVTWVFYLGWLFFKLISEL